MQKRILISFLLSMAHVIIQPMSYNDYPDLPRQEAKKSPCTSLEQLSVESMIDHLNTYQQMGMIEKCIKTKMQDPDNQNNNELFADFLQDLQNLVEKSAFKKRYPHWQSATPNINIALLMRDFERLRIWNTLRPEPVPFEPSKDSALNRYQILPGLSEDSTSDGYYSTSSDNYSDIYSDDPDYLSWDGFDSEVEKNGQTQFEQQEQIFLVALAGHNKQQQKEISASSKEKQE